MRAGRLFVSLIVVAASSQLVPLAARPQGNSPQTPPGLEKKEMRVLRPTGHAVSKPVREQARLEQQPEFDAPEPGKTGPSKPAGGGSGNTDPVLQTVYPNSAAPVVQASFGGLTWNGSFPPDTNLAVGDTQVIEIVNTQFMVYDKAGNPQLPGGPASLKSVFAPLGSDPCATYGGGDPVVVYDRIANRWVTTHYAFTPNYMCIGVSQTSDATGVYNLYSYSFGPNTADYAKFAVWRDGYYMSANTFSPAGSFIGGQACAFDRATMIAGGAAPAVVCFQSSGSWASLLPADLDSANLPAPGTPDYFVNLNGSNSLNLYKFHADFATPANSTFTGPTVMTVAAFDQGCYACVPQPGTKEELETLSSRLMFRLSYHRFATYESLLVNHTVQVVMNSPQKTQTGVRWYEIRNPGGTPSIAQQSTFSPDTTTYRWMGSIAQDKQGNMFLGYSAASATLYPSIRYTGRLSTDPLNQLQREQTLITGLGNQILSPSNTTGRDRWGDYATVALDPVDECTFWFATEYLTFSGYNNWATHLVRAKFAGCS